MKKIKIIIIVIFCLLLLPHSVYAGGGLTNESAIIDSVINDGSNSMFADATVGEVDTPIYSATIIWYNFRFEWKYDDEEKTYVWKAADACQKMGIADVETFVAKMEEGILYDDDSCLVEPTSFDESKEYYYFKTELPYANNDGAYIEIVDETENGRIKPFLSWDVSDDYEYVDATFKYQTLVLECTLIDNESHFDYLVENHIALYTDNQCEEEFYGDKQYQESKYYTMSPTEKVGEIKGTTTATEIPEEARVNYGSDGRDHYLLRLYLKNKTKPTETPNTGDKIGTLTITISAAE